MQLFDLHCDTLYRALTENGSIIDNSYHISLKRGAQYEKWVQTMAVWIPDEVKGKAAFDLVIKCSEKLNDELINCPYDIKHIKTFKELRENKASGNIILSIENGSALNGDLNNIKLFSSMGVRFMTLTWNGANEIGDGAGVEKPVGITSFGRRAVEELEKESIVVDISHASEALFWDVMEIAKRPVIATHSNSNSICDHKRNLTDDQFKTIVSGGGIVGLNLHRYFIRKNGDAEIFHILPHLDRFLSLGGEKSVALGCDFDGGEMPLRVQGIESLRALYELLLKKNYNEELIRNLFFRNAYKFCENFDNQPFLV